VLSVSVVVRCFNEELHLGNLLEAVASQEGVTPEVIVVDSGSTDGSVRIAESAGARILHIKKEDFTFGRSLNIGCAAATADFIVIASAHVIPSRSDWLLQMLEPFENPNVAKVYGRQIGDESSRFSEHEVFAKQFPAVSNAVQTVPFCNNANSAIRTELWQRNPYDETLSGLEDVAWGKWALENGFVLAYNADAVISHIHHESPSRILNRYRREALALKRILPDSHMGFGMFAKLLCQNILNDEVRAVKAGKFWRYWREIVMFRTMQYWGTYTGLSSRSVLTEEMLTRFYYPRELGKIQRLKSRLTSSNSQGEVVNASGGRPSTHEGPFGTGSGEELPEP
jgi:glycosyltransferase involved in cell wall biosynthesis